MPAEKLRSLLESPGIITMPCCFDPVSARMIERAGFPLTFMSGFAVSAARLGVPDAGLISYGEMVDQGRNICQSVAIPVIGDGDTGYGNALNVKRTVQGYASAGFACVMIEDQVAPKRCGHTQGKQVVDRAEALTRIAAACDARKEVRDRGGDILIMARTDARTTDGLGEALARVEAFTQCGADITFLEAPESEEEMRRYCAETPGYKMANMVEQGKTPVLAPAQLEEIGYNIAAYPLTLLLASMQAMEKALADLKAGTHPTNIASFDDLKNLVGFPEYYAEEERYKGG
jgi:2-methylisocitrate lyase-like PEP mutase family enzyme